MVDKEFYITGDNKDIFDVGFRPALMVLGDEVGIKVHATNLRQDKRIRVVASGSHDSIITFYNMIKEKQVSTMFNESSQYEPTNLNDYDGLDIDWNSSNQQFIAAQLSKTMVHSSEVLNKISKRLDEIYEKVSSEKK